MKAIVYFDCNKCGCQTPGMTEIPESIDQERVIRLSIECHHCDAPLKKHMKVKDVSKLVPVEKR